MKVRFEGDVKLPNFHALSTTPKTEKSMYRQKTKIKAMKPTKE
jgi:hypothetical protein